ncbi:hypothetical protein F4780DRAFT_775751 [Xylariomycetidae sp. FL0641]|nr:hypothetical protein F4780DRAFT_775751 [Xylariomycetidae sp. FL0641]
MPSRSSKHHENHSSTANKTAEEWYTVTDHDERRRIQNKLAQRKFRMKAREQKERAERESRNHEHAGSSYRIPDPDALGPEDEDPSGLPWGSINMKHVVAKGHESESRRGSGNDGSHGSQYYANKGYNSQQQQQQQQQASNYGSQYSSGADDQHYPQQQQQQQHASNYSSQHSRGEYDQYYGG